jgi:hypothetical protein
MRGSCRAGIVLLALWIALAAGLYPVAAGHRVEARTQRTVSCTTMEGALQLSAFATNPQIGSANVTISTGDPGLFTALLGVSSSQRQYGLDGRCRTSAKRVVLSHRGLSPAGVVRAGDVRSPTVYCGATRRVLLRLVIPYNSSQRPASAKIEVLTQPKPHSGEKSKRVGYVQWSPKRSVTYYSSACTSQY